MADAKPRKGPKVNTDQLHARWNADKKSRIFYQLAEEYRKQDFVDAAISVLREGLKHHGSFQPARISLARCFLAKRQFAEAQSELERVHAKAPDNLLAGRLLAEVLEERGERTKALEVLKALVPFAPDDVEISERIDRISADLAPARSEVPLATGVEADEFDTATFEREPADAGESAGLGDAPDLEAPGMEAPGLALPDSSTPADAFTAPEPLDATIQAPAADATLLTPAPSPTPSPPASEAPADPLADSSSAPLGDETILTGASDVTLTDTPPASVDDLVPAPSAPPLPPEQVVETEDEFTSVTLAELYESQGAHGEAAAIYEKLLERSPGDPNLTVALERCRAATAGPVPADGDPAGGPAAPADSTPFGDAPPVPADAPLADPLDVGADPLAVAGPPTAAPQPFDDQATELLDVAAGPPTDAAAPAPGPLDADPLPAVTPEPPVAAPAAVDVSAATDPGRMAATLAELQRWLVAVRAVRQ